MDEVLLVSEGGGRRREDASPRLFNGRTQAITRGSAYEKAAALVDLVTTPFSFLPEQILDQASFQSSAKFYFFFTKFDFLWSLNYFALIVLNFLEVSILLLHRSSCKH